MNVLKKLLLLLVLPALAALSACSFHKIIVNEHIRHLDTSSIVVGQTTQIEVLERLGPVAPVATTEKALKNVNERFFVYTCWESQEAGLEIAYFIVLPFFWRDAKPIENLVVEVDENGIVSDLYRVKDECLWRPLQGEGSREPISLEYPIGRKG